ncbi:MAG: tRNA (adenosine(37)-N6)-dimethylallyltransferase MiaA, partial [Lachnospiraceae bacterium]|nr:tRNA (adenosine(37)-N6)-dimethylallyltransferase MiaA [Lachnospiraceae bacterium]
DCTVAMQGLGYKQLLAHLRGECTLEEAVGRIKQETRHFAKRQMTWFRREKDVIFYNKSIRSEVEILNDMLTILEDKSIV